MIHNLQQARTAGFMGPFFHPFNQRALKRRFYKFYPVAGGAYFITSEQGQFKEDRLYSINYIRDSGRVTTRFYRQLGSHKAAEKLCRKLQRVANALSCETDMEYDCA